MLAKKFIHSRYLSTVKKNVSRSLPSPREESFKCLYGMLKSHEKHDIDASLAYFDDNATMFSVLKNKKMVDRFDIFRHYSLNRDGIYGQVFFPDHHEGAHFKSLDENLCSWEGAFALATERGTFNVRFSAVLRKEDQDWKILHFHNSTMPN